MAASISSPESSPRKRRAAEPEELEESQNKRLRLASPAVEVEEPAPALSLREEEEALFGEGNSSRGETELAVLMCVEVAMGGTSSTCTA